jgi:LAO/AO transport system kinase
VDVARLVQRLIAGQPRALARLLTAVENGVPESGAILAALEPQLGHARVLGITGPPGVGKSTLVGALVSALRGRHMTVGVIAVDPSSPGSGGAILGDRVRMTAHAGDPGVFIRSVSARGHGDGLSAATAAMVDLMDCAGRDVVVIETVGAGQSDVGIAELADCNVVVMAPGLGDHVQAIKSGMLEIADVLVVNKADLPHAPRTREELQAMLGLRRDEFADVQVLETVAREGVGIVTLADAIQARWRRDPASHRASTSRDRMRRLLAQAGAAQTRAAIMGASREQLDAVSQAVKTGSVSLETAASRLARDLLNLSGA